MRICLVAFLSMLAAVTVAAQTPSAGVTGRVTGGSGAVVPGAFIKLTNLDTAISQQAVTNESGDFVIPYVNPGRYMLEAQAAGFRNHKHQDFTLVVDQVLRLDIQLEV